MNQRADLALKQQKNQLETRQYHVFPPYCERNC